MDIKQTLALYDEEERRTIEYPGLRREEAQSVVRHVDLNGKDSLVLYSTLDLNNVDAVIQEQISYFEKLGHDFEWKYYEHDSPPALKTCLISNGFEIGDTDSIVALDLKDIPEALMRTATHDVRRISDPNQINEVMIVQDEIWQYNQDSHTRRQLLYEMQNTPDSIGVYVAYADDLPVASSWIRFTNASQFAGLWGGSTLPGYRNRGIYTAMLAVRAQEALDRGKRFVTVDAGDMSLPILQKLGFQLLTISNPCEWRLRK